MGHRKCRAPKILAGIFPAGVADRASRRFARIRHRTLELRDWGLQARWTSSAMRMSKRVPPKAWVSGAETILPRLSFFLCLLRAVMRDQPMKKTPFSFLSHRASRFAFLSAPLAAHSRSSMPHTSRTCRRQPSMV